MTEFKLSDHFIEKYKTIKPPFGFNGLGELVYMRTYSRVKDDGSNEKWYETIERVVNGTFNMQKEWIENHQLGWNATKSQKSAQEMYDRMFHMKFLPPGRGLWAMGSNITKERKLYSALNNCAFVSTSQMKDDPTRPFTFLMDASMLGVGVGFDTKGAGTITIKGINKTKPTINYVIPDSREGWVESLRLLLDSYFNYTSEYVFDYSSIREAGLPIKGFGGLSSGSKCLIDMHDSIRSILEKETGNLVSSRVIVDIQNLIGACVVAGNVRRCLPEGTYIHTDKGLIEIQNIDPKIHKAYTTDGLHEISELVYQGRQQVLKLETQNGILECTDKHKIAVLINKTEYKWKHANELVVGDKLVFPINIVEGVKTKLPDWKYKKPLHSTTCKDITIPELDSDMSWFLGLIHGDGHITLRKENNSVSVACSTEYQNIIDDTKTQFSRFGVNVNITNPRINDNCYKINAVSTQLNYYLRQFKLPNQTIVIPEYIMQSTKDIRGSYLAGLFDADGSSKTRPTVLVSTVYEQYVHQLQVLYASLGIPTYIKVKYRKEKNWKTIYILCVKGAFATERLEKLVMCYSRKYRKITKKLLSNNDYHYGDIRKSTDTFSYNHKLDTTLNLIPMTLKSIEVGETKETYDISVPSKNEFICHTGLLVHNTAEIAIGEHNDTDYLDLKNYDKNPDRSMFGWTSNNSVFCDIGMNYSKIAERTKMNGEPGYIWLDNIKSFSRIDEHDNKDHRAVGTNPSLRFGTKLLTTDGIYEIQDLQDKEFSVYNLNGKVSPAKCFLSGKNKQLYKVSLIGGRSYYATAEHKWAVYNNGSFEKVTTDELKPKMLFPVIRHDSLNYGSVGTKDDGFLLGWIYGDGWFVKRSDNHRYQLGMCVGFSDDLNNNITQKLIGILKTIDPNFKGEFTKRDKKGTYEINISNDKIINHLLELGLTKKEEGIPNIIWRDASEQFRLGFVDGLLSSDGSISKTNGTIVLSSSREKLLNDMSELFGFYGIKNNVYKRTSKASFPNGKDYDREYTIYSMRISEAKSKTQFKNIFNLTNTTKSNKLKIWENTQNPKYSDLIQISSIEKTDLFEDVWDVTVNDDTHCFQLSHCITGNCSEQSLEHMELCCLVETFPTKHDNLEDYKKTLKYAYLYAKTVTLGNTQWAETNRVMLRNRRIGCSMSGIAQFITKHGINELKSWCTEGYKHIENLDKIYSDWLAIPLSIKKTSIKPSGSVSLLAGATPGMHYPESRFYKRTMRLGINSDLVQPLKDAGYHIEPSVTDPENTLVVTIPVDVGEGIRTARDLSIWEQTALTAFLQKYWADNQVSCTITFDPKTEANQIEPILNYYQYQLKSISFLPRTEKGSFPQMPYEEITEDVYNEISSKLTDLKFENKVRNEKAELDLFCDGEKCTIDAMRQMKQ